MAVFIWLGFAQLYAISQSKSFIDWVFNFFFMAFILPLYVGVIGFVVFVIPYLIFMGAMFILFR